MESRLSRMAIRVTAALHYPDDSPEIAEKVVRAIFDEVSYYGIKYSIYPKELGSGLEDVDIYWGRSGAALYQRLRALCGQIRYLGRKITFEEVMARVEDSFRQNPAKVTERVARSVLAGEDWLITDEIKRLMLQVVREIQHRGGSATVTGGKIVVHKFVLDKMHSIPIEIRLYDGTYFPGKVLVDAWFGSDHPVPVQDRLPFNAKAVVDAIVKAFMSLVNYREAGVARQAGSDYPTMQRVEQADLYDLVYWNRYLPGPGTWAMGHPNFESELDKEARLLRRIMDRIKELGGITPEVSKAVGWNRTADDLGLRSDSADARIDIGINEAMDQLEYQPHKMWTGLDKGIKPTVPRRTTTFPSGRKDVPRSKGISEGMRKAPMKIHHVTLPSGRKAAEELLVLAKELVGIDFQTQDMSASMLLAVAKDILAMDFPTQDALDKYLKDHPDADKSNHRVVKYDPSDMSTHPMNLMRQRKNEEKMTDIARHYGKKPGDLTNREIEKFNRGRK